MLVFESTRRKTSQSKVENKQKTQPTYRTGQVGESNLGHTGGRWVLSPLRHPRSHEGEGYTTLFTYL